MYIYIYIFILHNIKNVKPKVMNEKINIDKEKCMTESTLNFCDKETVSPNYSLRRFAYFARSSF